MEMMTPNNDVATSNPRRQFFVRAGIWVLVFAGLIGMAFAIDLGRQAVAGEDLVPWEAGLERGAELSHETGKPMLVNFTADWCGPCRQMEATVFSKPHVAEEIAERFVPVKVDLTAPRRDGPEAAAVARYRIMGPPTYLVISPEGEVVSSQLGATSEANMLAWLRRASE